MEVEIPGYTIERILGKGGMAKVYLATQDIFERKVALKIMSKSLADDPTFGQRFQREAKIVSQLEHPNIVTVHDVGVHQGAYYLAMEYIDGADLKHRRRSLSLQEQIRAVRDIAKALAFAGAKGFVHRDIKPENIMFHKHDGRAVLTDFGIARAAEGDISMTQTGVAIGTPHYMSPEQAKGKPVDNRSDLYSLGVVFYLMLAGEVPFDGESAVAIGIKHLTEPVPLLPVGCEDLQPLVDRLMAKSPAQRYQSATAFIADLDRIDTYDYDHPVSIDNTQSDVLYVKTGETDAVTVDHPTGADMDTQRFAVEIEPELQVIPKDASTLRLLVSLMFVVGVVMWLVYVARPESLEPWIQKAEQVAADLWQQGQDYWQAFYHQYVAEYFKASQSGK